MQAPNSFLICTKNIFFEADLCCSWIREWPRGFVQDRRNLHPCGLPGWQRDHRGRDGYDEKKSHHRRWMPQGVSMIPSSSLLKLGCPSFFTDWIKKQYSTCHVRKAYFYHQRQFICHFQIHSEIFLLLNKICMQCIFIRRLSQCNMQ